MCVDEIQKCNLDEDILIVAFSTLQHGSYTVYQGSVSQNRHKYNFTDIPLKRVLT